MAFFVCSTSFHLLFSELCGWVQMVRSGRPAKGRPFDRCGGIICRGDLSFQNQETSFTFQFFFPLFLLSSLFLSSWLLSSLLIVFLPILICIMHMGDFLLYGKVSLCSIWGGIFMCVGNTPSHILSVPVLLAILLGFGSLHCFPFPTRYCKCFPRSQVTQVWS